MEKLNKKTKLELAIGIFYSFAISVLALIFVFMDSPLYFRASKELIFVASEILSFSVIFSFFTEVFIRRFEDK